MTTTRTEIQAIPQMHTEVPADPLTLTFLVLFAASEVLGASNLKANSVIQLILRLVSGFKPVRQEDEMVAELRQEVAELTETIHRLQQTVKPRRTTRVSDN